MAKNKKNPSVTLKQSDINRMKREITKDAINKAFILIFTVLHDKWGFGPKRLSKVFNQVQELSLMINEPPKCVTMAELERVLRDELNINFEKKVTDDENT